MRHWTDAITDEALQRAADRGCLTIVVVEPDRNEHAVSIVYGADLQPASAAWHRKFYREGGTA